MTTHTYKILEDNTIEMWVPGQSQEEPPVLRQPVHPDNRPWIDKEEAEGWIQNYIAEQVKLQQPEEPVVE